MIKVIENLKKKHFGLSYKTKLDMSTCMQRLSSEHLRKIKRDDDGLLYKKNGLVFYYWETKKGNNSNNSLYSPFLL